MENHGIWTRDVKDGFWLCVEKNGFHVRSIRDVAVVVHDPRKPVVIGTEINDMNYATGVGF